MNIHFDWDEDKECINIKKHGIDFESASFVFLDENRIEIYDELHSDTENRFITIRHGGRSIDGRLYRKKQFGPHNIGKMCHKKREREVLSWELKNL